MSTIEALSVVSELLVQQKISGQKAGGERDK